MLSIKKKLWIFQTNIGDYYLCIFLCLRITLKTTYKKPRIIFSSILGWMRHYSFELTTNCLIILLLFDNSLL